MKHWDKSTLTRVNTAFGFHTLVVKLSLFSEKYVKLPRKHCHIIKTLHQLMILSFKLLPFQLVEKQTSLKLWISLVDLSDEDLCTKLDDLAHKVWLLQSVNVLFTFSLSTPRAAAAWPLRVCTQCRFAPLAVCPHETVCGRLSSGILPRTLSDSVVVASFLRGWSAAVSRAQSLEKKIKLIPKQFQVSSYSWLK